MMRFIILFLVCIMMPLAAQAAELDMHAFRQIPILHEGRIKPIDSFARATFKTLSGSEAQADAILAEALFDPASAISRPLFKIENADLRHDLGLPDLEKPVYSLEQITPALRKTQLQIPALLQKDKGERSAEDMALLDLHDKALSFVQILRSFSLVLPMNINLPAKYKQDKAAQTYLGLKRLEQKITDDTKRIVARKGDELQNYTDEERKIALLAYQLQIMGNAGSNNTMFRVLPPAWSQENAEWRAPWDIIESGQGSPQISALLSQWQNLGQAYIDQDPQKWQLVSEKILNATLAEAKSPGLAFSLRLEILYNHLHPFELATGIFAFSFLLVLFYLAWPRARQLLNAGCLLFIAAMTLQGFGIGIRVFLLHRPPVGTLYESLLFVSLLMALIAFTLETRGRNGIGILIGGFGCAFLGLLSFGFMSDGDNLSLLTAVLNTQFWLATHVLCITAGYAWCLIAALLAHVILIRPRYLAQLLAPLHIVAIFALLFTAVGTILGGIWADQSWGRFWGWDPKENGALLTTLWLIWLLHARLGGQVNTAGFVSGMAATTIIVALSWIGVNLLGVGLHSYGFTDGVFTGLIIFIFAEFLLIGILWRTNIKTLCAPT